MQRMIGFPIPEEELSSGCTFDLTVGSHRSLFSCWARGNDALVNCELSTWPDHSGEQAASVLLQAPYLVRKIRHLKTLRVYVC